MRRVLILLIAGGVLAVVVIVARGTVERALREVTLPLRHEDIIRQQANDKHLPADLIAAVIYEETRFRPRTSPAGAKGLMQILPATAQFIASRSGGTRFELRDLADPQVNIAYGAYYLRYLTDRYEGNSTLAVAAYNAGETRVDRWVETAGGPGLFDPQASIPFPETRNYVLDVEERRREYRRHYADELGL